MRVGYCKVYSQFEGRILRDLERKFLEYSFSGNDSFIGTKVLGTFVPEERKFHRNESSKERMFHGTKVQRSESSLYGLFAPGNESAEERKGLDSNIFYQHRPLLPIYRCENSMYYVMQNPKPSDCDLVYLLL